MLKVKPKIYEIPSGSPYLPIFSDDRYELVRDIPTDLTLSNRIFNQGETIYSFGDITITGTLTNNSPNPVIIIASGEINIEPTANIVGNFEFRSGQVLPPNFPTSPPLPPMSFAEIQNFCTKGEYKAKDNPKPLKDDEPTKEQSIANKTVTTSTAFTVSPNPFTTQVAVDYNIVTPTEATLVLSNALGQTVKSINLGTKDEGNYQELIETSDLPRGVYLLTLRTQDGAETKKLVKQ